LDPHANPDGLTAPRSSGLDKVIAKLNYQDRTMILEKIKAMRQKAAELKDGEELPLGLGGRDKDKIVEQYFATKRKLQPDAVLRR